MTRREGNAGIGGHSLRESVVIMFAHWIVTRHLGCAQSKQLAKHSKRSADEILAENQRFYSVFRAL
jgi:hypothetical protein